MAIVKKYPRTSTLPPYVEIFPNDYKEGEKLPVDFFLHGIGELTTKKTLDEFASFHTFLHKGVDAKRIIQVLPQDDGTSLFDDKEVVALLPVVDKYCNGQLFISGLSRGAGTTMSIIMSNSVVKAKRTASIIMCPPTWESMNEFLFDDKPTWIFAGALDDADPTSHSTRIDRQVNTIDDIRKAGKGKNLYFSVFPNDDHYIWTEVMGAVGVPPINPTNGAASWTAGGITVECVNDPACDVYDFLLLQKPNDYKPLPRKSTIQPAPVPAPTTTTAKSVMRVNITGAGKAGYINVVLQYIDSGGNKSSDAPRLATEVDTVQVSGKTRYTIKNKGVLVMPTFEI